MPRRPKPAQPDVRQRILDAALHEFSLGGYHGAILDSIALKAGVSKGAVYWHFENKRTLFLVVVQREMSRLMERLETLASEKDQPPTARIEALVVTTLTYYAEHPEFCNLVKVFMLPGGPGLDEEMEAMARAEYRRARMMIDALLQEGVERGELDPERVKSAAPMFVALADGLMSQWTVDPEAVPLRRVAPEVARAFLQGVVKR